MKYYTKIIMCIAFSMWITWGYIAIKEPINFWAGLLLTLFCFALFLEEKSK